MKNIHYYFIIAILSLIIGLLNIDYQSSKDIYDVRFDEGYISSSKTLNPNTSIGNNLPMNSVFPTNSKPTGTPINVPPVLKQDDYMSAAFEYSLGDARLIGEAGCMREDVALSINPIESNQLPPLNQGMVNVTGDNTGYRMLPKGMVFKNDIDIILPYDTTLLPIGFTPNDIKTYYYDERYKRWIEIERDSVDKNNQLVISKVNHFTDFINAIIKLPEMPETASFAPTQMNDIKAANPLEALPLMQPPTANNMGTANINYPLWIPAGRKGMQPNLNLSYNSSGGNGWMGLGWDINIPMITTETRWGVPYHNEQHESETYILNGEQLATKYFDEETQKLKYNPLSHRAPWKLRPTNTSETRFYPRVEGAFQKIVRHGTNPTNYYWEVTDKNGTKYFYGKKIDQDALDPNSVLLDYNHHVCKWGLTEIRDLNGNFVQFKYSVANQYSTEKFLIIQQIVYTGHNNNGNITNGLYTIDFILKNRLNNEKTTNCRLGVVEVCDKMLDRIEIKYNTEFVKAYKFCYETGNFQKILLKELMEIDQSSYNSQGDYCGNAKYVSTHKFDYYGIAITDEGKIFGAPETITSDNDDNAKGLVFPFIKQEGSILGSTASSSWNIGGAVTVGFLSIPNIKVLSVGGNYMYTRGYTKGIVSLLDIDGDGLPDKVYKNDDNNLISYRKLIKNSNSTYSYGEVTDVFPGLPILKGRSNTHGFGLECQIGSENAGLTLAYNRSKSKSYISSFFTDVDGDGLVDLANDEKVFLNRPINGVPFFTPCTSNTTYVGGSCETETFYQDDSVSTSLFSENDTIYTYIVDGEANVDSVMQIIPKEDLYLPDHDAVRMWVAPYNGTINLQSTVGLTVNLQDPRRETRTLDGVKVSIQYNSTILDSCSITPTDSIRNYSTTMQVQRGDKFYFRIESKSYRTFDRVYWAPHIKYTYYGSTPCDTNHINGDGVKQFVYDSKKDFFIDANQKYYMPLQGTGQIDIKSNFSITSNLSDTIRVYIYKNNIVVKDTMFPKNTTISNFPFNVENLDVAYYDSLWFKVVSKTNVKWDAIQWFPQFYYDSTTMQGVTLYDYSLDGVAHTPQTKIDAIPQCTDYPNTIIPTIPFIPTQNTQVTSIRPYADGYSGTEPVVFSIKNDNGVVFQKVLSSLQQTITLNITLLANTKYYFEWYTSHEYDISSLPISNSSCIIYPSNTTIQMGFYSNHLKDNLIYGNLYRNWGQFTYMKESPTSKSINQSLLHLSTRALTPPAQNSNTAPQVIGDIGGEGFVNFTNGYDPLTENFLMMDPDIFNKRWNGYSNITYIGSDTMSNTYVFENTVEDIEYPIAVTTYTSNPKCVVKTSESISNNFSLTAGIEAPDKIKDFFHAKGIQLNATSSFTWGHSRNLNDYVDMNGDRFPDVRTPYKIQYSKPQGGLSPFTKACVPETGRENEYSSNDGKSQNFGASFNIVKNSTSGAKFKGNKISNTGGPSTSISTNSDDSETMWLDINGDGLPDNLKSSGKYFLNLGYSYLEYETLNQIYSGKDTSKGVAVGLGVLNEMSNKAFNLCSTSFSGGVGLNNSDPATSATLVDVNGDGLPDLLTKNGSTVKVQYNLGTSFDSPDTLTNISEINKSKGFSTNLYGSFGIGFLFTAVKLDINPQIGGSWSLSDNEIQFTDMNGDGLVDYVKKNGDNITVRYNQVNKLKVNILKSVSNYAGGSYTIGYKLSDNSFNCPNSTLVMDTLIVYDGYHGDGVDYQLKTFEYENPMYNRADRDQMGFEIVTTIDRDYNTNDAYRKIVQKYHNTDYSRKGLQYYELITDANDNKYVEKFFNYVSKEIASGDIIISDRPFCYGEGYPALNEEIVNYYEGQPTAGITTKITYEHGPFGNVVRYHDYQNMSATETTDDVIAEITYQSDPQNKYLVGIPQSITVTDINNNILRYRTSEMDPNNGNIDFIHIFNNGISSDYDYHYDIYGNIISMFYPENVNQQRSECSFVFDPNVHTYPLEITNNTFGYSSYSDFNFYFGKPTSIKDVNGNEMKYQYDGFGRTMLIKGPNDPVFTLQFSYSVNPPNFSFGLIQSATTQHYDAQNDPNTLNTILFVDGLGRVIQTKKDIEMDGAEYCSVSGHVDYDAFGRAINQYYPITEPISTLNGVINPNIDAVSPTIIEYDIMDRKTQVTLPNGIITSLSYGINAPYFLTNTTDPNGFITSKYIDTRGLDRMIIAPGNITTRLYYNSLGELIQTTDPDNHSTYYSYDMLGQKISRQHPDAGTETMTYDPAGNLISRETANLSGISPIIYNYDYNRLVKINYPLNPENNVDYFYGDNSAIDNRIGKIYAVEDASGRQEFSYGKMGEVLKNIRTFALPNEQNTYTFVMEFAYDSWNRIMSTIYPDGEKLYYFYNRGGLLKRMESDYNGTPYLYIDSINYNKFEKRTFIQYGNGTFADYTYDVLQRLSNLKSYSNTGMMQDINYTFDDNNNILSLINYAGMQSNGLGGIYSHDYSYDNNNRLITSGGTWDNGNTTLNYSLGLQYDNDGKIKQKSLYADVLLNGNLFSTNYSNDYSYYSGQSHTVENVYENNSQLNQKFEWDPNGNLVSHYTEFPESNERHLCWDEENRLMAVKDNNYTSYYIYDNSGERTFKLTGTNSNMNINGNWYSVTQLNNPTLYTSGYVVANNQGYTKHYYAGSERISSAIGLGGLTNIDIPLETSSYGSWEEKISSLGEKLDRTLSECIRIPYSTEYSLENLKSLKDIGSGTMDRYFYHPDHLGSSSWITDNNGYTIQYLHYLPFGEDWVDERNSSWFTPYTFSAKEKDVETGYGYFGARYYDSGLSIWLSVDPMSDKYPSMSPYNYCASNPVILVDPDGNSPKDPPGSKNKVNVGELVNGVSGVVMGGVMMIGGIAAVISGVGAPVGTASMITSVPVMGCGVAKIIDAFDGGKRDIPSSATGAVARAVETTFKFDKGSIEQPATLLEAFLTFNPKSTTQACVMGADLLVQAMTNNQNNINNNNNSKSKSTTNSNNSTLNNTQSKQKYTLPKADDNQAKNNDIHSWYKALEQ